VFGGGWGEDWQVGGKARFPATFPDGTANTIGYFEWYAVCGKEGSTTGSKYVERIWCEDGQNAGPRAEWPGRNPDNVRFCPAWWAFRGTDGGADSMPAGYPNNYVTLPQIAPLKEDCDPRRLQAHTVGGMQVLLMDGSVRSISPALTQTTFAAAINPADNIPLGADWGS
jgi:hypothetical protein